MAVGEAEAGSVRRLMLVFALETAGAAEVGAGSLCLLVEAEADATLAGFLDLDLVTLVVLALGSNEDFAALALGSRFGLGIAELESEMTITELLDIETCERESSVMMIGPL